MAKDPIMTRCYLRRRRADSLAIFVLAAACCCWSLPTSSAFQPLTPTDAILRCRAPPLAPPRRLLHDTKAPNNEKSTARRTKSFLPFRDNDDEAIMTNRKGLHLAADDPDESSLTSSSSSSSSDDKPPALELNLWTARALLLLVAAIWGTNFASVKYLEGLCFHPPCHHPPSEAAFARFGIAALVSWPLLLNQPLNVILAGLECGLTITLGYITQAMALTTIESGKCAFICSLTVVFVPVVAAIVYGKPIKPSTVLAGAIALTGVGVLEGLIDLEGLLGMPQAVAETGDAVMSANLNGVAAPEVAVAAISSSSINMAASSLAGPLESVARTLGVSKGDLIALGQPLGFGYTFLRIEHYQEQFKDVPNRVLTIAAAQCVSVGILSFLWVLYDYQWTLPNFSYMIEPHRVATVLWTGIVTTVAAIFLEGIALQKASATDASIAFASEPVWASLFGFLLLKEQLGFDSYLGGAIIMLACIVGAAADLKEQEDAKMRAMKP